MLDTFPEHYRIAQQELGIQELRGEANNPRVVAYHDATGLDAPADQTPWCGSFVAWVFQQAGIPYNRTMAAAARSWETFGTAVEEPAIGDLAVFWRKSPDSGLGHVGFFSGWTDDGQVLILGGNQNDRVSIQAYPTTRLIGFRRPPGMEDSMSAKTPNSGAMKVAKHNKVIGGTLAAAVTTLIIKFADLQMSADEQSALTVVVALAIAWLVPNLTDEVKK